MSKKKPTVCPEMIVDVDGANKGFKCKCGETHMFPAYLYAHWCENLTFTCPKCHFKYEVCYGVVTEA